MKSAGPRRDRYTLSEDRLFLLFVAISQVRRGG